MAPHRRGGPAMELRSPHLQRLYRDWQSWRGTRQFPSRADLDPAALHYVLGNLTVVDVFYNPTRFFYRAHATSSAERAGFDLTGKFLDALPDETLRATIRDNLLPVLKKRAPHLVSYYGRPVSGLMTGDLEVLVLPFSSNGQTIDMIAYGTHFDLDTAP
jgi:hypothetical protein